MLLLVAALFILALELFIPSAGMLFMMAMLCVIASVVVAFMVDSWHGMGFLTLVFVLALILPSIGFQLWKRSPVGKRMFLENTLTAGGLADETLADGSPSYASLLGQVGRTVTPLRPAGATEFAGRRVDTVAEGVMIDRGELVKVVDVQGNRVVVRKVERKELDLSLLEDM